MIPAWVWTSLIVVASCIGAIWLGSYLPESGYNPVITLGLVVFAAFCVICAIYNNFPFLLAFGSWIPFFPHLLGPSSLPTVAYFTIWMAVILFFRLCVQGYISYRKSYNWAMLIVFAWVPIRFMMNPVTHLGATAGGSGVSGALPYFAYVFAGAQTVFIGAVLNDRNKITLFMRCCYIIALLSGLALCICAFTPATGPYLIAMGSFNAGDMGDGIQRLVQLPGYGLFLVEVSLCPALFRLKWWHCIGLFVLGFVMIILGGNRSALAGAAISVPVILFVRRQTNAMVIGLIAMVLCFVALRVTVANMDMANMPPLMRSLGVFDSRIDKASGGDASANWRYEVWQDALVKIMESPLVGKGFGNLPDHLQRSDLERGTPDFESLLAGGESHNGFINAAYGFGIPFMLLLSSFIFIYLFKEVALALTTDKHDPEMIDLHAFLAGMFANYPILIYTAFDLGDHLLFSYMAISCVLSHLPRQQMSPASGAELPLRKYGEEMRPAGSYNYRPR